MASRALFRGSPLRSAARRRVLHDDVEPVHAHHERLVERDLRHALVAVAGEPRSTGALREAGRVGKQSMCLAVQYEQDTKGAECILPVACENTRTAEECAPSERMKRW